MGEINTPVTQDRLIYVRWSDDGQHIRKWAREPFEGATAFANAGNGAPLGPFDADDHYPVKDLPFALRSIAENIHVQCADHVLEDMVRIVTDAASVIEDRHRQSSNAGGVEDIDARALEACPILDNERLDRDVGLARSSWRNGYKAALASLSTPTAEPPSPCPGDRMLPRLDAGLIEAAMIAHYGKSSADAGIDGVDLTVNDHNWTFREGFKRMWNGVRKELKRRAALQHKGEVSRG